MFQWFVTRHRCAPLPEPALTPALSTTSSVPTFFLNVCSLAESRPLLPFFKLFFNSFDMRLLIDVDDLIDDSIDESSGGSAMSSE